MRFLLGFLALALGFAAAPASAQVPTKCGGKFINPITDIAWSAMFPLSIGSLKIWPSDRPDTPNPDLPVCACANPFPRIGIAVGFWEPARLVDATQKPWCFPNLGGVKLDPGFDIGMGQATGVGRGSGRDAGSSNWHSHYYVYPLLHWMEILADFACFEQSTFDLAYVSEIDPMWNDDMLTTLINPEVALFANPIAIAACAGDCIAATAKLPNDALFWCAGCQGTMYPMNGNVAAQVARVQASRLAAQRMLYKMHRMGLAWGTSGSRAMCSKYLMPILKKSQYRVQMTNPIATVRGRHAASPIGSSTLPPDAGRHYPVGGEDMGYLMWRKRNCCML